MVDIGSGMSSSSIVKSLSFQLVMISFARRIQLNLRLLLRFLFAFLVTIFVLLNLTTLSVDNRIPVNLLSKGSLLPVASSRYKRIPEPNTATLDDDDFSTLLNITDFRFDLNQPQKCKSTELFMLIFIHSAVGNFEKRNTIRKTWGNDQLWNKSENPIRIVFMVGESGNATIDKQLKVENNNYNDIIQGNFKDSYHNITYKHVMGLKWVTYFCSNAKYIFKSDDDIFVDPIQLIYYLKGTIGQCPKNLMACYVNPHSPVFRGYRNKWRVGFRVSLPSLFGHSLLINILLLEISGIPRQSLSKILCRLGRHYVSRCGVCPLPGSSKSALFLDRRCLHHGNSGSRSQH